MSENRTPHFEFILRNLGMTMKRQKRSISFTGVRARRHLGFLVPALRRSRAGCKICQLGHRRESRCNEPRYATTFFSQKSLATLD